MPKKYVVCLTADERKGLLRVTKERGVAAWKAQRAQALLKFDASEDGPAWPDSKIAEAFGITTRSLESWRKRAVEEGPFSLLERKPPDSPRACPKLDGEVEAQLTKLACSPAPEGHARWTLRLLAERLVELEAVESISHETVRRGLKKAN